MDKLFKSCSDEAAICVSLAANAHNRYSRSCFLSGKLFLVGKVYDIGDLFVKRVLCFFGPQHIVLPDRITRTGPCGSLYR